MAIIFCAFRSTTMDTCSSTNGEIRTSTTETSPFRTIHFKYRFLCTVLITASKFLKQLNSTISRITKTCQSMWLLFSRIRPPVCMSVPSSDHPSVRPSLCPFVRLSARLFICPSVNPSVHPSICPYVHRSDCLSIHPSICPSISLSVRLFNHLSLLKFLPKAI